MKKKLFMPALFACFSFLINAQVGKVGINTEKPQTTLDVNGNMQLRNELQVNGTAGTAGQVYFSQGNATLNDWKPVNVPFLEDGQYQLVNTYAKKDQVGIDFTGSTSTTVTVLNETFESGSATRASWTQSQETGSSNWTFVNGDGSGSGNTNTAHGGSANARFVRGTTTQKTKLISPTLNFSAYNTDLTLSFWYGQKEETTSCNFQTIRAINKLVVFYRTSTNGTTWTGWTQIQTYTAAANSWTQVTNFTLPNSAGKQYYQLAFEGETIWNTYSCLFGGSGTLQGYANVLDDVVITGAVSNGNTYNPTLSNLGETIVSKNWSKISGLDLQVSIKSNDNKISMIFQTGVESRMNPGSGNQTAGNVRYMCGIFKRLNSESNDAATLVALRPDQINNTVNKTNANKSQSIYTLNYTVNDIPAGDYVFSTACRRLSLTDGNGAANSSLLSIGNAIGAVSANEDFMLSSVIKMDVIEMVTVTGN